MQMQHNVATRPGTLCMATKVSIMLPVRQTTETGEPISVVKKSGFA